MNDKRGDFTDLLCFTNLAFPQSLLLNLFPFTVVELRSLRVKLSNGTKLVLASLKTQIIVSNFSYRVRFYGATLVLFALKRNLFPEPDGVGKALLVAICLKHNVLFRLVHFYVFRLLFGLRHFLISDRLLVN